MPHQAYSAKHIAELVGGELIETGKNGIVIKQIYFDSRKIYYSRQVLFVAIKNHSNDGHNYIKNAYEKGVNCFLISDFEAIDKSFQNTAFILVKNSLKALQQLCAYHRRKFAFPVIGITGSNGKTIVKEWLYQLISPDRNVVRSPKSYNSQLGVPLSVWQMKPEHELGIFEAGISMPEEMDSLQKIVLPNLGIFTNIGSAHDTNFTNHTEKIKEKVKLFRESEKIIYCSDYDEINDVLKEEFAGRLFSWSKNHEADLKINQIVVEKKHSRISAVFENNSISIEIPFTDNASIENAIHCLATMLELGYSQEVIYERFKQLHAIEMRLELNEGINNCTIINDSYNSDINSLEIALDFLKQQNQHKKKTLILSDILQLSSDYDSLYKSVAELLKSKEISHFIGIGKEIKRISKYYHRSTDFYNSTDDFLQKLRVNTFHNQSILIKGARKFTFEKINSALQQKSHETVLEINLDAIAQNLAYYRHKLKLYTKIMAMVKAFSYGSGHFEIANLLQFHNIDYLAVAYADEGVSLRKRNIRCPIMVMNTSISGFESIIKHNLEPEIFSLSILKAFIGYIIEQSLEQQIRIHIKIDTGMHRLGIMLNEIDECMQLIKQNDDKLKVVSVFSHLAAAENETHNDFTKQQIKDFHIASARIEEALNTTIIKHILNSAGISHFVDFQYDMVRIGLGLYGISYDQQEQKDLLEVSTLRSLITQIKVIKKGDTVSYGRLFLAKKDMKIGVIPIGYADGLDRRLGNGVGSFIIKGQQAPIIGSVCMDMCMVNLEGIDVQEKEYAVLFGKGQSIMTISEKLNTIPYEVISSISQRVKRVYLKE